MKKLSKMGDEDKINCIFVSNLIFNKTINFYDAYLV